MEKPIPSRNYKYMSKRKKYYLFTLIIVLLPIAIYILLSTERRVNWEFGTHFDNSLEVHYFISGTGRIYHMMGDNNDDHWPSLAGASIEKHEIINFMEQLNLIYNSKEYYEYVLQGLNSMADNTFRENEFSFYGYTNDEKYGSTLHVIMTKKREGYNVLISNGWD